MSSRVRVAALAALALGTIVLGVPQVGAQEAAGAAEAAIPASTSFTIDGTVTRSKTYDEAALRQLPVTTESVYFGTGAGPVSATYTGVLLWTLLQEASIEVDPAVKNGLLRRTITVSATDGYTAVLSAGEIAPQYGGALAIVAYARDGRPLGADGGFARLIVPGDQAGGRHVSSIAIIEVK